MAVKKQSFGKLSDGTEVFLYTIINEKGESVSVTEYGASVVAINIRDRERNLCDIALGCLALLIMRNRQHAWVEFQEDMQIESARVDLF